MDWCLHSYEGINVIGDTDRMFAPSNDVNLIRDLSNVMRSYYANSNVWDVIKL